MSVNTYTYQWQTSPDGSTGWTNISGAIASTYTPVAGDVGKFLRAQVTATDDGGNATAFSTATAAVLAAGVATFLPAVHGGSF